MTFDAIFRITLYLILPVVSIIGILIWQLFVHKEHWFVKMIKNNMRQYGMLIALIIIVLLFQVLTSDLIKMLEKDQIHSIGQFFAVIADGTLLKPQNVTNLILQNSYVIILAIGMVLCIITGGNIDLSVGSIVAFIGSIVGTLIVTMKMNLWLAIVIAIFVGILIGIWQGYWIAYVRIPAFIVTLAGMLLFRGLTLAVLKGQTISPFPDAFNNISKGFMPDFLNFFNFKINFTTLVVAVILGLIYIAYVIKSRVSKKKYGFEVVSAKLVIIQVVLVLTALGLFAYSLASFKGIPVILIILAVLTLVYSFFTNKTVPGRYIYAMGGNEKAAKLSGINTNKVLFFTYVNMATLAAFAGIVFTARLQAATPLAGQNFELDAIAACFIGGASATGGFGTVVGAIIGAFVMGVLNNGMSILGAGSEWQMAIKGFVLLMAVVFDIISKNKAKA